MMLLNSLITSMNNGGAAKITSTLAYLSKKLPNTIVLDLTLKIMSRKVFRAPKDLRLWTQSAGGDVMAVMVHNEDLRGETNHFEHVSIFSSNSKEQKFLDLFHEAIDWNKRLMFRSVSPSVATLLKDIAPTDVGFFSGQDEFSIMAALGDVIPLKQPKPYEDILRVGSVGPEHIPTLMKHWDYCDDNTPLWMEEVCGKGFCHGCFLDEKLASWILMYRYGEMGAMVTLPEYHGMGLAGLSMASLASHIKHELGLVPYANITSSNKASLRVAERVGLKRVGTVNWMFWTPWRFRERPTDYRFFADDVAITSEPHVTRTTF